MATKPTGEVMVAEATYQRGDLFKEIDHDRVANAIRYLSFAKLYYPDKYHEFLKLVALHHATWSMEDSNFITALYEFERGFTELLEAHPTVEQEVNRLSPKQMVDRVDTKEIANAKERRDAARKMAQRVVANAIKRGAQVPREKEIEEAVRSAAIEAETPVQLQQFIKDRIPIAVPVVDQIVQEDPRIMQKLLLSDPESTRGILDQTVFSPLPNKRALHTILTHLPMDPNETRERFLNRAQSVAQTAMVLSSDLSQTPLPHVAPSGFIEAMLSVQNDRRAINALAAFNKLTERAKNAVSLTVVAKAWEDTVDVVTRRAGGALVQHLEPLIYEANKQPLGGSTKQVASLVSGVVGPILGHTFTNLQDIEALNRSLSPGQGLFPDRNSVASYVESLDATRRAGGAANAMLFLTITTDYPGVQFVEQHTENPLAPAFTVVGFVKDGVAGRIIDRAAKSEAARGFLGKILGFFGIRAGVKVAAGAAAGRGASALIGSLLGGTVVPVVGHIIGLVGGFLVMPLVNKVGGWIKNLVTGRVGQLGVVIGSLESVFGGGARAPSAPKRWYEQDWVPIVLIIGTAVFVPMFGAMMQISTQNAALVTSGAGNQPDVFMEHELYPQPDYIDFTGLENREFSCLTYGEGISTSYGRSRRLSPDQEAKVDGAIAAYPQIKLLSCSINCSSPINVTAFNKDAVYAGYAPSGLSDNVVFYPKAFRFTTQNFAKLLAHELSHNIDWRGAALAGGFYALGCEKTGTYPRGWGEAPEETFAEAVGLHMIGWPNIKSYCGGKALTYFDGALNQCR